MAKINLSKLSLDELKKLGKDIDKAIKAAETQNRKAALKAAEDAAQKHGFSLAELTGGQTAKSKPAAPPKYRHPENSGVTWSGRGRQPGWIKDGLKAGKSLDDFAI